MYFPQPSQRSIRAMVWKKRHHFSEDALQCALKRAATEATLDKFATRVSLHTSRRSFAAHLLAHGYSIRTVRDLLGHKDIRTTQIYLDTVNRAGSSVRSPLDVR
jgi:site-specific recombinase XerD